ncbi:MAG: FkbM family methyltransferase [Rhodospirillales bacterium]|nr:FkbM family methyltransferase [Rhodospirillales bacterium]
MSLVEIGTAIPLSLPVPHPVAANWLEEMSRLGTAEAMRRAMAERYPGLTSHPRRLAIVGAAAEGRRLAALCQAQGIEVAAIGDDSPARHGEIIAGRAVGPLDRLSGLEKDIPVVIASHRPLRTVERLRAMGFQTVLMFLVLQALEPERFPPCMFYDGWFEDLASNGDRYRRLRDRLGDDASRRHLEAILGFRLTGDIGALAPVVDWDLYYPRDLFTFGINEVYVDAGTFLGDSIALFIARTGGHFTRVLGFEPDAATFPGLRANFSAEPRVELINKGLHAASGVLRFIHAGERGSMIAATETAADGTIDVAALDDILGDGRVTYIKMNIEGAETDALRGAARAIRRWRPRLAISAYHFPRDLWRIPSVIEDIDPSYRLHLRQHDAGSVETVVYAL